MKTKRLGCELTGMILVLASAGWQVFVQQTVAGLEAGSHRYSMDTKLDAMWFVLADSYSHQYPDRARGFMSSTDIGSLDKSWHRVSDPKQFETIKWQNEVAAWISGVLFLTGSFLVVAAKWLELREAKRQPV